MYPRYDGIGRIVNSASIRRTRAMHKILAPTDRVPRASVSTNFQRVGAHLSHVRARRGHRVSVPPVGGYALGTGVRCGFAIAVFQRCCSLSIPCYKASIWSSRGSAVSILYDCPSRRSDTLCAGRPKPCRRRVPDLSAGAGLLLPSNQPFYGGVSESGTVPGHAQPPSAPG